EENRRDADAFLIDFTREGHGTGAHAADVGVVGAGGDVEIRRLALTGEDAGHGSDVGEMGATAEGIVEDYGVTGFEVECAESVRDGKRHGPEMHGHVVAH